MRTSIDIPEPLFQRAKLVARERGVTLRELVLEGLRTAIEKTPSRSQHRMKDRSYGEGGLVAGLSWSESERIDELTYRDRG